MSRTSELSASTAARTGSPSERYVAVLLGRRSGSRREPATPAPSRRSASGRGPARCCRAAAAPPAPRTGSGAAATCARQPVLRGPLAHQHQPDSVHAGVIGENGGDDGVEPLEPAQVAGEDHGRRPPRSSRRGASAASAPYSGRSKLLRTTIRSSSAGSRRSRAARMSSESTTTTAAAPAGPEVEPHQDSIDDRVSELPGQSSDLGVQVHAVVDEGAATKARRPRTSSTRAGPAARWSTSPRRGADPRSTRSATSRLNRTMLRGRRSRPPRSGRIRSRRTRKPSMVSAAGADTGAVSGL